ncbi:hypothetical protein UPYG_G00094760 [Umbra pygmaea]|uniref:Uncharacterized protein n=1 Tax=Umbra pygmaea TaxID=75934 RepID=A0ABD0XFJ0_UMBPY
MAPIRDSVSHSPNQTGLEHPGLDSQYENSPWSTGSHCSSDSNSNWGKVLVDSVCIDKPSPLASSSAWPSSGSSSAAGSGCSSGSDPELPSECMDADSSPGSDNHLTSTMMAAVTSSVPSANFNGDTNGNRNHSNGSAPPGNGSSNNVIMCNGAVKVPWGGGANSCTSTETDESHGNKLGPWSSANGAGLTQSTLNPSSSHGAWAASPGCKTGLPGGSLGWGEQQENQSLVEQKHDLLNGTTSKAHHLNTEANHGPNHTTNAINTSSLPNSGSSVLMSEPGTGLRSLGVEGPAPGSQLSNGPLSTSQHPHSEGPSGGFSTPWSAPSPGDTVNGQAKPSSAAYQNNNPSPAPGGRWDSAPHLSWGGAGASNGNGAGTAGIPRPWGSSSSSSSSSSGSSNKQPTNGEWSSLPGNNTQHSSDGRKPGGGANGWKSLEDDALGVGVEKVGGPGVQSGGWGKSGGSEGSGESSGGRSSDRDTQRNGPRRRGPLPGSTPVLSRSDVDPRVLCNTGWGQTPVRQNTAWDVTAPAPAPRPDKRPTNGGPGWGSAGNSAPSHSSGSGGWGDGLANTGPESGGPGCGDRDTKGPGGAGGARGWDDGHAYQNNANHSSSTSSWGERHKEERSNTWTNAPKPQKHGWGTPGGGGSHWGEPQKTSECWDSERDRSGSGGWGDPGRGNGSNWGSGGGSSAPEQIQNINSHSGWGEQPRPASQSHQAPGGWGEPALKHPSHPSQSWGDPGPSEWGKGPESNSVHRGPPPGAPQHPIPQCSKPSGWMSSPMPAGSSQKAEATTGWEEPSPESVRRRMEVDDGTAAWGDPSKYNSSGVNMWNKTSQSETEAVVMATPPQQPPPPPIQHPPPQNNAVSKETCSPGWGGQYGGPQKMESGTWGEPACPPVSVDNGTSAWGKPVEARSRPKPMQQENSALKCHYQRCLGSPAGKQRRKWK